jgi:hypothetical protein
MSHDLKSLRNTLIVAMIAIAGYMFLILAQHH